MVEKAVAEEPEGEEVCYSICNFCSSLCNIRVTSRTSGGEKRIQVPERCPDCGLRIAG